MKPSPRQERSVWIWAASLWFLFSATLTLISLYSFRMGIVSVDDKQKAYFEAMTSFDYVATTTLASLNLLGAVFLFLLRKPAPYLFSAAFALNVLFTTWHAMGKGMLSVISAGHLTSFVFGLAIQLAVCIYCWRLTKQRVLM